MNSLDKLKNPILWADGIIIYEEEGTISLPIQFSFCVWRRAIYDLCLDSEDNKPILKVANTYEHKVCHVKFDDKEGTQGQS